MRPSFFGETMAYDFNRVIERRGTNSIKWQHFPQDVLPLWVADMDFAAPEPVIAALRSKVDHGVFGYESPSMQLLETVADRMQRLYGWQVSPASILATPGVVAGFNAAACTVCASGEGLLVQPPVYPPFLTVNKNADLVRQDAPLSLSARGATLYYSVDFDVFDRAINSSGVKTSMFLLCNPHNPTGQAYSRSNLDTMARKCLQNNIIICSDEIHSEILPGGTNHIPLASLDPEIADRSITLIAPSKTFNVPGLFCGFAIIPNKELLQRYKKITERMTMHVNGLGLMAAQVAYSGVCDDWLASLNAYLKANRDFLVDTIKTEFPGIKTTVPEATYLAWLDCNEWLNSRRITITAHEFFLKQARVGLNDGRDFGLGGEGFVRLNFGCPRSTLEEALRRMKTAMENEVNP
jgi:cystathionine beta-lyase